jgi:hypothetical protein
MKIVQKLLGAVIVSTLAISRAMAQADAPANPPADAQANPPAAAPAAPQTGITLVNIHMKQSLPEDAFDELAKQGGVKFTPNNNLWDQDSMQGGMDVDITNKPFWSALREICALWNIVPQGNEGYGPGRGGGRRIQLYSAQQFGNQNNTWTKLPTTESQGFLIQATGFNRQQSINYAMPDNHQDFCNIQLMVYVDPSLRLSGSNITCKATEAVDDAGNSMMPDNSNNNMFYGGQQRSLIFNSSVSLKYPAHPGKKIAHLKGMLTCRGSDKVDTMTVDKPLEAEESTKSFGDVGITFHSLKKTGDNTYEMKLSVTKDDNQNGGNDWGMLQGGQLLDEKGRAYNYGGGGSGGGNNGTFDYTMNFNANGDSISAPVKWQIELPSKSHTIKVPVEFTDLPLP